MHCCFVYSVSGSTDPFILSMATLSREVKQCLQARGGSFGGAQRERLGIVVQSEDGRNWRVGSGRAQVL